MSILVPPDGPIPAKVMIVGEAPGAEEERAGTPFVGVSGQEMNRMLHEAGLSRSEAFVTNVVRVRPLGNAIDTLIAMKKKDITPAHQQLRDKFVLPPVLEGFQLLRKEIEAVKPEIIIAFGNTPMWALTGRWAVTKWRGSMLLSDELISNRPIRVIPTYHPAAVLRQWEWRATAVNDLRRAKRYRDQDYPSPAWDFIVRPSFSQVIDCLEKLILRANHESCPLEIGFDLETRVGHISCVGISWTLQKAICIPIMYTGNREGYWSLEEEAQITHRIYRLLVHKNVEVIWQNGLYDAQYTHRHWHFIPNGKQDTMISQHSIFSALPKSLAFQASMYCDYYVYWKDEGKNFNTGGRDEEKGWIYNCEDCVYTVESARVEAQTVKKLGLEKVHEFQQQLFWPVLKAMLRGVRVDLKKRNELIAEVQDEIARREQFLKDVLGHPLNPNSSKQMIALFYDDLKFPPIMTRAKKGKPGHVTCDDEALQKMAAKEPLLKPIINAIADIRTLGIFLSNFLTKPLDVDQRMRCSYNIGGSESGKSAPVTYRLSSSENAFGSGGNLQNIPSAKSKSLGKAAARGGISMLGDPYQLPNLRSMFVPDPGFTFFDTDLDRADLHVFVWEIDDALYKETLRRGIDSHLLHVYLLDGKEPPPLDELVESHPKYWDHRGPRKHKREFSKVFCHATDYVGSPRTVAAHTGRTVHEIDRARKLYLSAHPNIEPYWKSVEEQVRKRRYVENKFGYRWYIFDRIDMVLPEAVAWIPQSTVSIIINKIWYNLYKNAPDIWVLMQVHDSLAGQFPTHLKERCLEQLKKESQIIVPYDDQLIIPTGVKTSEISWGDC